MERVLARICAWLVLGAMGFAAAQPAVPEIPYEASASFLRYPDDMNLGELASVAVNSKRHVFVLSRSNTVGPLFGAAATQLLEFDARGQFLREIGHNLYGLGYAHSVRVDAQDRVWVVDKGTNVVVRFDAHGHVDLVLGRKNEATDPYEPPKRGPKRQFDGYFNQPTDVAWNAAGDIFVSDGYMNSRIAHYDSAGNWVGTWGSFGDRPGEFNTPHNIGIDNAGRIYVADRGNARIQVFDPSGRYVRSIRIEVPVASGAQPSLPPPPASQVATESRAEAGDPSAGNPAYAPGAPWTICITPGATQYLYTSDAYPGRIYKLTLEGEVVGVLGQAGRQPGRFNWLHGIACPSENLLYVADLNNWRVQRLVLKTASSAGRH